MPESELQTRAAQLVKECFHNFIYVGDSSRKGACAECVADALAAEAQAAALRERERCARIAEKVGAGFDNDWNHKLGIAHNMVEACGDVADAIRSTPEATA